MKEEELIKKLRNVALPDIRLQGHQCRLRMALLDAGYRKQQKVAICDLAKLKLKGVKDAMIRGLVSRQPVWKTATVTILALIVVLGLGLAIPSLTAESVYAQAAEIAQNSPEIHEVLGAAGDIQVVKVIKVVDDKGTVIAKGEMGIASAKVDLKTKEVSDVVVLTELTEAGEQNAIDIAKADLRVKELLAQGSTLGEVSTMYICGSMGNVKTGEIEEFSKALMTVEIKGSDMIYVAHIDLNEGKLVRITEIPFPGISDKSPVSAGVFLFTPDPEADIDSGEEDS